MEEVKVDVVKAAEARVQALAVEREELIKAVNEIDNQRQALENRRGQLVNRIVGLEGALQEISLLLHPVPLKAAVIPEVVDPALAAGAKPA